MFRAEGENVCKGLKAGNCSVCLTAEGQFFCQVVGWEKSCRWGLSQRGRQGEVVGCLEDGGKKFESYTRCDN